MRLILFTWCCLEQGRQADPRKQLGIGHASPKIRSYGRPKEELREDKQSRLRGPAGKVQPPLRLREPGGSEIGGRLAGGLGGGRAGAGASASPGAAPGTPRAGSAM